MFVRVFHCEPTKPLFFDFSNLELEVKLSVNFNLIECWWILSCDLCCAEAKGRQPNEAFTAQNYTY